MIAYAISNPSTLNFQTLKSNLKRFAQKADMIVYRDKESADYEANAKQFMVEAREHAFTKILLHTDYKLAHKLKADGVHLNSTQFSEIENAKALGLFVVISTHSKEEALQAQNLGADMTTFSPIFSTPNKGEPKGVEVLRDVISSLEIAVIALGGIVEQEQIDLCEEAGAFGFASIRYFG